VRRTTITVRYGRTQSLESYSNVRPEITLGAELDEGDDPEAAKAQLFAEARAFVEEAIDQAVEWDGRGAKFSKEPRYRLAHTAEQIYTGDGWARNHKTVAPERLLVLLPQAIRLDIDDNPGRRWWSEPYGPPNKLRLSHALRVAEEWLGDHAGYRLIDCADGDLSKIPTWALEALPGPTPEPAPVAAAPPLDDIDEEDEGDDEDDEE
jgi:hypothetical protein